MLPLQMNISRLTAIPSASQAAFPPACLDVAMNTTRCQWWQNLPSTAIRPVSQTACQLAAAAVAQLKTNIREDTTSYITRGLKTTTKPRTRQKTKRRRQWPNSTTSPRRRTRNNKTSWIPNAILSVNRRVYHLVAKGAARTRERSWEMSKRRRRRMNEKNKDWKRKKRLRKCTNLSPGSARLHVPR